MSHNRHIARLSNTMLKMEALYGMLVLPNYEHALVAYPDEEIVTIHIAQWSNGHRVKLKDMSALLKRNGYVITNPREPTAYVKFRKVINSETGEYAYAWLYSPDNILTRMAVTHAIPGLICSIHGDHVHVIKIVET